MFLLALVRVVHEKGREKHLVVSFFTLQTNKNVKHDNQTQNL